ncbi:PepSY domain-containing protein [Sphingomonas sp. SUN019]|uniref:PepSY-associated TM helix domain-containing protein n=1 Tax=Sphingomonas sp. SUN019 TaxID=2937788 RepID=UPI0021648467|nr:PepSY domain-containing protein [Sphingomonas sp. SUN019]UVO49022.1 PepSY domain-containing protein [Sphingomonas sp. SUN019]
MTATIAPRREWPSYTSVWRWHFYAGLFCIPFVLWLALTGSVYLFRPQIEALIDRPYADVATTGPRERAARQSAAAVAAVPGSVLHRYQLPDTPTQAVQIIVGKDKAETRVYVHPQTLAVLKTVDEDQRLMRIVFRLHGEMLAGDPGSYLVELAASWAIVMILSGLFLWWPRGRGPAGVIWPRLSAGGRRFWRDLHAVTGFWVSFMALFLLLSGLPWAKSWGSYLKVVRSAVEGQPVRQDWTVGRSGEVRARGAADAGTRAMLEDHADHGGMPMADPAASYAPLDNMVATVVPLDLAAPVLIAPPTGPGQPWTAKSDAADRPQRTDLTLDPATGAVLTRKDFAERRLVDRLIGYGIAVHEGALFGWLNQLLNLATALGLMLLSISGAVMWWRRRPSGKLGAPVARVRAPAAIGFFALIVTFGVMLPLFGASLLIVLVADRLIVAKGGFRRL